MGHYGDLVLRSDGEAALVDMMKDSKGRGNRRTVIEHSSMRSVEEMARLIKLDLEHRLTTRLDVTYLVFAWLVEHAVHLRNKIIAGSDGKNSFRTFEGHDVPW